MKNKIGFLCPFFTLILLSTSCGDSSKSGRSSLRNEESSNPDDSQPGDTPSALPLDGSNIQGTYIAKFQTLNSLIVGTIPGSAQLRREEDKLFAYLRLFAGSPSTAHFQNVHSGTRCPTLVDDTNGDGFIDYPEALAVVGPVIIPLDWDIGTQSSGNISWPKAFPNGSYEYLKEADFSRFWNDLREEDSNPNDNLVKIPATEVFDVTGKVVIVQGVAEVKTLPDSVAGYKRWKNFQTLPIVCGVFAPNLEDPGTIYDETITGPIAPVVDGQDQPAPVGADEIPGTGTVIEGPSNETGENDSPPTEPEREPETPESEDETTGNP